MAEFSPPDPVLEDKFNGEFDKCFMLCRSRWRPDHCISNLVCSILKLKKKKSRGFDKLCGLPLVHPSDKLLCHLQLLLQMVFNSGLVPH